MASAAAPDSSETQLRRAAALESALRPIAGISPTPKVVEILLNADGRIWVDRLGHGMRAPAARMGPAAAERMLHLVASEMGVELNAAPSLAAKLPPPYGARLQASIPPLVDAPGSAPLTITREAPAPLAGVELHSRGAVRLLWEAFRQAEGELQEERRDLRSACTRRGGSPDARAPARNGARERPAARDRHGGERPGLGPLPPARRSAGEGHRWNGASGDPRRRAVRPLPSRQMGSALSATAE